MNVTINLPERTLIRNVGGEAKYVDWAKVPASVFTDLIPGAAIVILNNCYNGEGKDAAEDVRWAKAQKRLDAWYNGTYLLTERATSATTLMREAYVMEMQAKHDGVSESTIEAKMKATVKAVLGNDAKATFDNFLHSIATNIAKASDGKQDQKAVYEALVAKYEKAAAELEASRAAVKIDIDLTDIDF